MVDGLSVCILAKDEESFIGRAIESVRKHCVEIIVVDDSSLDKTVAVAKDLGALVVSSPFTVRDKGFGEVATWMIRQARGEWILVLDADEIMPEIPTIYPLFRDKEKTAWVLPRRKWLDYEAGVREEYSSYPDWQVRLFKNSLECVFYGEMHVRFKGPRTYSAFRGPHIEHLQTPSRTAEKTLHRALLYPTLANRQGVAVEGGAVEVK